MVVEVNPVHVGCWPSVGIVPGVLNITWFRLLGLNMSASRALAGDEVLVQRLGLSILYIGLLDARIQGPSS